MTDSRVDELTNRLSTLEAWSRQHWGTWTPAFTGTGTAGAFTYTSQVGIFARWQRLVYVTGRMTISAIGTPPVGNMRITGLPFTCEVTYAHPATFGFISQIDLSANVVQLTGTVAPGSTYIELWESFDNAAAAAYPAANFTNTAADLIFSATYRIGG